MTETLAAQRAELERSNRIKAWAQMARQVAHEIKNPLTPIQLAAEHLQRVHQDQRQPLGAVFDQCVATILRQVKLLRQIASEFSNFAAEPVPRPERVDVAALLDSIVDPYRLGVVERRIEVATRYDPDLPAVRVDRTLVARALTNLVENAVQAMPDGGRLRVAARRTDDHIRIDVADTGVGMDADAATRAFEPYFSTKTGGSGLGLPNAKRYVELSGGALSLETRPGAGTTITVTLPVAPRGGSEAG
jgi:nitrogen fixation/metabolism regulation signal transduction histidine kinase